MCALTWAARLRNDSDMDLKIGIIIIIDLYGFLLLSVYKDIYCGLIKRILNLILGTFRMTDALFKWVYGPF